MCLKFQKDSKLFNFRSNSTEIQFEHLKRIKNYSNLLSLEINQIKYLVEIDEIINKIENIIVSTLFHTKEIKY